MTSPLPPRPEDRPSGDPGAPIAPATGVTDPAFTELAPGEEPVATGTLFLTTIVLMIIGAFWVIIYGRLIDR